MNRKIPAEFSKLAKYLIYNMTLDEKVGQTLYEAPAIERLGIKAYNWWNEALHGVARAGVATVFPQAIGLAATFDEETVEKAAGVIANEARAKFNMQQKYGDTDIYKGLTFWSPNVNIFRDPRWGRGHETYGEDPYLTGRLGVSFVNGLQGKDDTYLKAAACAKHFCVHSGPEDVRHGFNAVVSDRDLNETYLPAFKACVEEAGVEAVMGAYNRTNSEPCCGSDKLLNKTLREEWGFAGHVTSDCWAIRDFHQGHNVTSTPVKSVALAMNSGCDLCCGECYKYLTEAVTKGLVEEATLDRAVERLLITKFRLGIFPDASKLEKEYADIVKILQTSFEKTGFGKGEFTDVDSENNRNINLETSKESMVLLKNEGNLLPLDKKKIKTIGIIGPNADNRKALVGNYEGTASEYVTVLDGIREKVGKDVRVLYSEGCHLYKGFLSSFLHDNDRESEVRAICNESDVVVAVMGLDSSLEGEEGDQGNAYASGDKPNIKFPGLQDRIMKVIAESGKPVVLLVLSGSALDLSYAKENIPAIMECWYPGAQGGRAVAGLLFGDCSPSGKLPLTFYRSTDDIPEFTDYAMKGRTYRYFEKEPVYPFGYGLSYNKYDACGAVVVSGDCADNINIADNKNTEKESGSSFRLTENNRIAINLDVKNAGRYKGSETVQVYIDTPFVENGPKTSLKALRKVHPAPGKTEHVEIELKYNDFGVFDNNGRFVVPDGKFTVKVCIGQETMKFTVEK